MAWFKTDDQLPDHRKSRAVRRSHLHKRRDASPFGIWVLAGAWSNDGFVPLEILEDWDDDAEELADRLVKARLWHRTTRDGEPGYIFHDWHDQNPARDDNDPSKSGSFGNHVRWHVQRGKVELDCDHCPKEPEIDRGDIGAIIAPIAPDDRGDAEIDRGESLPSRPVPTRPDPSPAPTTSSDKSDQTKPNRFSEFWDVYGKKVGKPKAVSAYKRAIKKSGVTEDLLISAAAEYVAWKKSEGKFPEFTKDPSTWLNGEHWADERAARVAAPTRTEQHLALVRKLAADEQGAQVLPLREIEGGRA